MKWISLAVSGFFALLLSLPAGAQPNPQGGPGAGMGPGGAGMGPGARGMRFQFSQRNTAGWNLMTPEERAAHRQKMMSAKTYEECKAAQEENHRQMEERAKGKGRTLPAPRQNACDRMKARGFYK